MLLSDWASSGRMVAITEAGLQLSTDGGALWQRTNSQLSWYRHLEASPVDPGTGAVTLFLAASSSLWRTSDLGQTETPLHPPHFGVLAKAT